MTGRRTYVPGFIACLLGVVLAPALAQGTPQTVAVPVAAPPAKVALPLLPDMVKGDPKARVTVVEYGSATCGHCAAWYNDNWAKFETSYIANGKVRYVFREVVTPPVELDYALYLLARCAAVARTPNKPDTRAYFSIIDGFWATQAKVYASGEVKPTLDDLTKKAGLTQDRATACLKDQKALDALDATMESHMTADKVDSTPTFFVNGQLIDGHDLAVIEKAVDEALGTTPQKPRKHLGRP